MHSYPTRYNGSLSEEINPENFLEAVFAELPPGMEQMLLQMVSREQLLQMAEQTLIQVLRRKVQEIVNQMR